MYLTFTPFHTSHITSAQQLHMAGSSQFGAPSPGESFWGSRPWGTRLFWMILRWGCWISVFPSVDRRVWGGAGTPSSWDFQGLSSGSLKDKCPNTPSFRVFC